MQSDLKSQPNLIPQLARLVHLIGHVDAQTLSPLKEVAYANSVSN